MRTVKSAHTPGPWVYAYGQVQTEDGHLVAMASRVPENGIKPTERDANMRLCAAAPELLALLVQLIGKDSDRYGYGAAHVALDDDFRERARQVIAKTTGKEAR